MKRWVLYDLDADELATTNVYRDYNEAIEDADELDNVLVVALEFESPEEDELVADICHYLSLQECVDSGKHLQNCDVDGYCNYCGNQEPGTMKTRRAEAIDRLTVFLRERVEVILARSRQGVPTEQAIKGYLDERAIRNLLEHEIPK